MSAAALALRAARATGAVAYRTRSGAFRQPLNAARGGRFVPAARCISSLPDQAAAATASEPPLSAPEAAKAPAAEAARDSGALDAISSSGTEHPGFADPAVQIPAADAVRDNGAFDAISSSAAAHPGFADPAAVPLRVSPTESGGASPLAPPATDAASTTTDTVAAAATATDPAAAAQAAEAIAETAAAGFSLSDTLLQPANLLLHFAHDATGLPWYLAIAAATLFVRTAMLPLSVITMKNSARMAALKDEIAARREVVMEAVRSGDRSKASVLQDDLKKFMTGAGVGPSKVLMGPLVQFPVFISFFVSVRRLSLNDPSMTTGGAAWFSDLSVSDPTLMLPVISAASMLAMMELGGDTGMKLTPGMKTGFRVMAAMTVPMTYWFPAGVFCYWLPNNVFSTAFSAIMKAPPVKRALGLNVDLATIPGTKAFEMKARKVALNPVEPTQISAAWAAASYIKKIDPVVVHAAGVARPEVDGKPVLLKHRPKKKGAKKKKRARA